MSDQADLQGVIDRFAAGRQSEADEAALRSAALDGQVRLAENEHAVRVGGEVTDAVIIAGDRNVVVRGQSAEVVKQALREVLKEHAPAPPIPLTRWTWRSWLRHQVTPRRVVVGIGGVAVGLAG